MNNICWLEATSWAYTFSILHSWSLDFVLILSQPVLHFFFLLFFINPLRPTTWLGPNSKKEEEAGEVEPLLVSECLSMDDGTGTWRKGRVRTIRSKEHFCWFHITHQECGIGPAHIWGLQKPEGTGDPFVLNSHLVWLHGKSPVWQILVCLIGPWNRM